jgi:hypothetical protein
LGAPDTGARQGPFRPAAKQGKAFNWRMIRKTGTGSP